MNTVAKGDAFEKRSLSIIKNMIEAKRIAVMENAYSIHEKKPYYSHDRKGNIIFDLTIEVKPPEADRFSIIYIIECKDYKTPVSIDRLEAFCSKIEQVAPRNSKAIFITSSRFQKSAKNYAESKGVMLVGVENDNSYNIMLYKSPRTDGGIKFFNKDEQKLSQGEEYLEKDIDTTLLEGLKSIKNAPNNISRHSKEDIESIANEILDEIDGSILKEGNDLSIEKMANYVNKALRLKVKNTTQPDILGCFNPKDGVIQVNHKLAENRRYKFVLAHEIGHCIIHDGVIIESELVNVMPDSEYNFKTNRNDLQNDKNWIEWQANYFAVCLTMPKYVFIAKLLHFQQLLNLREGKIYVDDQADNVKDFVKITNKMPQYFLLSKTCIINRLKELDMLVDNSRMKSIGHIMHEYQSQFFF